MGQCNVSSVMYKTHVALQCGCSIPTAQGLIKMGAVDAAALGPFLK